MIVGFTEYGNSNSAAYFGENVAYTSIFSLLILLVLLVTPYRKKVAIGIVIGSTWFASSIYSSVELYKSGAQSREMAKNAVNIMDDFTGNKKINHITNVSAGELTFVQLMQNYIVNIQRIRGAYDAELNEANLAEMLSPENLIDEKSLKSSKKSLSSILSNIPKYEVELEQEALNFEEILSSRNDKDSVDALRGFQKTKENGVILLKLLYKNQASIVSTVGEMVDQADRLLGKLVIENGQLIFPNQEELDKYNNSLNEINKLSLEEQKIQDSQQGKIKALTEELRKQI